MTAVVLHFHREQALAVMLDRLAPRPVDEVVVVDNGSVAGLGEIVRHHPSVRVLEPGQNLGIAGRNLAAREARGEFLLMLDDDAYPQPGAIEIALEALRLDPRLAVVGGLVRDVDERGAVIRDGGVGSFDWFLRAGQEGESPPTGFPAFFYPEGACLMRRDAFLETGGYLEPFFWGCEGMDVTTRLVAKGWDVRYLPSALFDHRRLRHTGDVMTDTDRLRLRFRNQIWYFWLRFPPSLAVRRIPAYLAFDFLEGAYRGELGAWWSAIREAWTQRDSVRPARAPLPRDALRRAELNRGRMHWRLLAEQFVGKARQHW